MTRRIYVAWLLSAASLAGCSCGQEIAKVPDADVVSLADGALPAGDASVPLADGAVQAADGAQPEPDAGVNHAPAVSLAATFVVIEGQALAMTAAGSDPDGDALTWSWEQTAGSPTVALTGTSAPTASFVAPAVASSSVIELAVTVCDPEPLCASAVTQVTIDRIPTIGSVAASPSPVDEGQVCSLTVEALDPGDPLSYRWTQTAGPAVALAGGSTPSATFDAPPVPGDTTLTFSIEVCDAFGACATGSVTVLEVDSWPTAQAAASPSPAAPFDTVTLDASGSTAPGGGALSFDWTQAAGPAVTLAGATSSQATFVAPLLQDDAVLTFEVEVCDAALRCDTVAVSVTVLGYDTYVSATGSDAAPTQCTKANPCRSIPAALGNAVAFGYPVVRVDEGDYPGSFDMADGAAVECGYDRTAGWTRQGTTSRILTTSAAGVRFPGGVDARLDGCTVTSQQGLGLADAAAVTVEGASAAIDGCTIDPTDSTALATLTEGLKIVGDGGAVTVSNSTILGGNSSKLPTGVMLSGSSTLTLDASTVRGSSQPAAVEARGVLVELGTANIASSTIEGGLASVAAFGIAGGPASRVSVSDSVVRGGTAVRTIGFGSSGAFGSVTSSSVEGGTSPAASAESPSTSAGLWLILGGTYLIDSNESITGGASVDESVGISGDGVTLHITGNTSIAGGSSAGESYGIRLINGTAEVSGNARISGGVAASKSVGLDIDGAEASITGNALIEGGAAPAGAPSATAFGVWVEVNGPGTVIADNGAIEGGWAQDLAVGIQLTTVEDLAIARNTLRGGQAAAAWGLRHGDPTGATPGISTLLTIDGNLVEPSTAAGAAETGGMYLGSTSGVVTNNRIFAGPGATSYGVHGRGSLAFFHNYVAGGGTPGAACKTYAMYLRGNNVPTGTFDNNIIDTGRMAAERYGVYEESGLAGFTPQEFAHNDFVPDPGQVLYRLSTAPGQDRKSAAEINAIGAQYYGNLDVDPLFADPAAGDYHLDPASPCIDQGLSSAQGPATDMDGDPRPKISGGAVDIGPDEAE